MKIKRTTKILLVVLALMLAVSATILYIRYSAIKKENEFYDFLGNIMYTNGTSSFCLSARAVKGIFLEKYAGRDIYAEYQNNQSNQKVRFGCAYILLLTENKDYPEYVNRHIKDYSDYDKNPELRIWTLVLGNKVQMSTEYRQKLMNILSQVDTPDVAFAFGMDAADKKDLNKAELMLKKLNKFPAWALQKQILSEKITQAKTTANEK